MLLNIIWTDKVNPIIQPINWGDKDFPPSELDPMTITDHWSLTIDHNLKIKSCKYKDDVLYIRL